MNIWGNFIFKRTELNLPKERLEVLKDCNCEEYEELKELIEEKKDLY